MSCKDKGILPIISCICIANVAAAITLVAIFRPWEARKASPQTRATPIALIDENSIFTSDYILPKPPVPELAIVRENESKVNIEHKEHPTKVEYTKQPKSAIGPEPVKKKKWLRFRSPSRHINQ